MGSGSRHEGTLLQAEAPILSPAQLRPREVLGEASRVLRRGLRVFLYALALLAGAPVAAAPRVVLVGVDGASWSVIDPLLAAGKLPNLAALLARGVSAELETVEPVISPVVWTSIATGQPPEVHGVKDFFADSRTIARPTIFERLAVQGLRVGTYEWLVTWPPRPLPGGFVIPDWLRRDLSLAPSDVFARAGVDDYRYSVRGVATRAGFRRTSFRELERKAAHWNALARAFELDAGAVSFYAIDALSHRFWADSFPAEFADGEAPAVEPGYEDTIPAAYQGLDRALGGIVAALPPECAVIVASDHGFQARDGWERVWGYTLEAPLAEAGLEPGRDAFALEGQFGFATLRVLPGPFAEREALLERLYHFLARAGAEDGRPLFGVVRLDAAVRPPGHERGLLDRLGQSFWRLVARLAFSVEFSDDAHAWLIARPMSETLESVWPDGRVTIAGRLRPAREVVYGDGFSGAHDPTAVFVAAGGPFRHDAARGRLSVLDVAPLYAYLAGAGIPDDLPGALPERLLEPAALAARPPRRVHAASLARLPEPAAPAIPDAEVLERLRALGYVE
jgi:hypothetical protein